MREYGMCGQVFTMAKLTGQWSSAFSEVQIMRANITLRSRYAANEPGLYAIMVVDNTSDISQFVWSESWYRTIACYPGAKVRRKSQNATLVWYPSEAGDKNYFTVSDSHAVFTIIYCMDYSESKDDYLPRGSLDVRVTMKGRMLPKRNINMGELLAAVERDRTATLVSHSETEEGEVICDFEHVSIKSPQ